MFWVLSQGSLDFKLLGELTIQEHVAHPLLPSIGLESSRDAVYSEGGKCLFFKDGGRSMGVHFNIYYSLNSIPSLYLLCKIIL